MSKKKEIIREIAAPSGEMAQVGRDQMHQSMYAAQTKKWDLELEQLNTEAKRRRESADRKTDGAKQSGLDPFSMMMMLGGNNPDKVQDMMAGLDSESLLKLKLLTSEDPNAALLFSMMNKQQSSNPRQQGDQMGIKDFLQFYTLMNQQKQAPPPQKESFGTKEILMLMTAMQKNQSDPTQFYGMMANLTKEFNDSMRQRDREFFQTQMQQLSSQIASPKDWLTGISSDVQQLQGLFGGGSRSDVEVRSDHELKLKKLELDEKSSERGEAREKMDSLMGVIQSAMDNFGEQLGAPLGDMIAKQAGARMGPQDGSGKVGMYDAERTQALQELAQEAPVQPSIDELNQPEMPPVQPVGSVQAPTKPEQSQKPPVATPTPAPPPKKKDQNMGDWLQEKWG